MGIRGILDIHNAVRTFLVAVLLVGDNSFCQHNVVFLVIPAKFDRVALVCQDKAVRCFYLGNSILTQRQGHGYFAFGAIMGNFQEIIGCLRAGGAKFYFVHLTLYASSNGGNEVTVFVPVCALTVWRGNVGCSVNFVHRAREVVLRVDELVVLVVSQHIAQLTNGKLTECFVVAVFLRDNVLIHVVGGIAHDLPNTVGLDFKFHRVGRIVIVPLRPLQFFDEIAPQRQFFRCFHLTVCVRIEHVGFLGGVTAGGIDHGNAGLITLVI